MSGVYNMNYMYSVNATATGQMTIIVDFGVQTDPNTDLILSQIRETQEASQTDVERNAVRLDLTKVDDCTADDRGALFTPRHARCEIPRQTMNTSTSTIQLPAFRESPACRFSAPDSTRCGSGSNRTSSPTSALPASDVVNAVQSQNTVNPAGQMGGEQAPRARSSRTRCGLGRLITP